MHRLLCTVELLRHMSTLTAEIMWIDLQLLWNSVRKIWHYR